MKKLTITHIHVSDKKNKGDYAIVLAVQQLLKKHFSINKIINLPIEVLSTYDEKILKKINNTDFLIIGGGGILYSYFLPFNTNFINGIKIPTFTFGIGYIKEIGSTDLNLKSKKSIISLFKKCSIFSVRDFNTKNYLTNLGLPAKKIPVIGDPAIFLKKIKYKSYKKNFFIE